MGIKINKNMTLESFYEQIKNMKESSKSKYITLQEGVFGGKKVALRKREPANDPLGGENKRIANAIMKLKLNNNQKEAIKFVSQAKIIDFRSLDSLTKIVKLAIHYRSNEADKDAAVKALIESCGCQIDAQSKEGELVFLPTGNDQSMNLHVSVKLVEDKCLKELREGFHQKPYGGVRPNNHLLSSSFVGTDSMNPCHPVIAFLSRNGERHAFVYHSNGIAYSAMRRLQDLEEEGYTVECVISGRNNNIVNTDPQDNTLTAMKRFCDIFKYPFGIISYEGERATWWVEADPATATVRLGAHDRSKSNLKSKNDLPKVDGKVIDI